MPEVPALGERAADGAFWEYSPIMLKHEDNLGVPSQSAAQKRVTPAEPASAIARLEAKREGEDDGTIAIGEAVSELGLAATPEVVWAEVEAVRAQRAEADWRKRRNVGLPILLASMVLGGFISLRITRTDPSERQSPPAVAVPAPQSAPTPVSLDPNLLVGDTTGRVVMLSEAGDDTPVRCYYERGIFQPYSLPGGGPSWTLIKHGVNVYVRGWMGRLSEQALNKTGEDVSLWKYSGFDVPVTLPIKDLRVTPQDGDETQFHTTNVHLDKYAHEKWKPWHRK